MEHFIEKLEDLTDNADIYRLHKLYKDLEDDIQAHIEELERLWVLDDKIGDLLSKLYDVFLYELWDAVGELICECDEELGALYADHEYVGCLILNRIEELEDV